MSNAIAATPTPNLAYGQKCKRCETHACKGAIPEHKFGSPVCIRVWYGCSPSDWRRLRLGVGSIRGPNSTGREKPK